MVDLINCALVYLRFLFTKQTNKNKNKKVKDENSNIEVINNTNISA